ncbi:MAG TPA: MoaD/ThiS family protein [Anaerolineales bacterium]|nr:MoaD/ThiS family protein [Anaerolineales bacterium]
MPGIRMPVVIRPLGMLKEYIGGQPEASVEAGRTIRETLRALGMPPELAALVLVNDEQQDKGYVLQEGDVLKVMAVIGGG